jgi:oligosaccharide repeat unit polymerase
MMQFIDYLLAWLFVISIYANAWAAMKIAGHWLNPGSIYALFWATMCTIPLIVAFGTPINALAVAYILLTSILFTCSMIPFDWKEAFELNAKKKTAFEVFATKTLFYSTLGFSALAITATIGKVLGAGFSATELLLNTLETAGAFAASRYEGELESSLLGKIGLLAAYLAVFTGGLFAAATKNKLQRTLTVIAAFLPAVLTAALQSAKGLLFLSLAFFYGAILIVRIFDKKYVLASKKDARGIFLGFLVLFPVIIASFLARGLTNFNDPSFIIGKLYSYLVSYSSGHLYAFSDWFSQYSGARSVLSYQKIESTPGFFSFLAAFRLAGDETTLPPGIYSEYFVFGDYLKSNIFTSFRGFITDFGLLGSLFVTFLIGSAANLIFLHILQAKRPVISISLFLLMIGAIYMSYIISIFTWSVIPVAIVACIIILKFNFLKIRFF